MTWQARPHTWPLAVGLGLALLAKTAAGAPAAVPDVSWQEIARGGDRPNRALHSMIYDPVNQLFWAYGGVEGDFEDDTFQDDLFKLDATSPEAQWQVVPLASKPPPLAYHTAIYDPKRQRMVVYGGLTERSTTGQSVASGATVWSLDLKDPDNVTWTRQGAQGMPVDRFAHGAVYVPEYDAMVVSGGAQTLDSLTATNYALLLGQRPLQWVRLANAGFNSRAGHLLAYDGPGKRVIAYGGTSDLGTLTALNEIIYLDVGKAIDGASSWRRLSTTAPAQRRAFMAGAFDPLRRLWWVQGGQEGANRYSRDLSVLDLSVDPPAWVRTQTVYNGPLERFGHVAAWDGARDRAVFQGGTSDGKATAADSRALVLAAAPTPTAGTVTRTPTATATHGQPSPTPTATGTPVPSATVTPSVTPQATATVTPTPTDTVEPTATASASPTATEAVSAPGLYLPFAVRRRR